MIHGPVGWLPHNEFLRPHDKLLLRLAMDALKAENEDNALICLRIIFDLHRNFRPSLEAEVTPFLLFVCELYKARPLTCVLFTMNQKPVFGFFCAVLRWVSAHGANDEVSCSATPCPPRAGVNPWGVCRVYE